MKRRLQHNRQPPGASPAAARTAPVVPQHSLCREGTLIHPFEGTQPAWCTPHPSPPVCLSPSTAAPAPTPLLCLFLSAVRGIDNAPHAFAPPETPALSALSPRVRAPQSITSFRWTATLQLPRTLFPPPVVGPTTLAPPAAFPAAPSAAPMHALPCIALWLTLYPGSRANPVSPLTCTADPAAHPGGRWPRGAAAACRAWRGTTRPPASRAAAAGGLVSPRQGTKMPPPPGSAGVDSSTGSGPSRRSSARSTRLVVHAGGGGAAQIENIASKHAADDGAPAVALRQAGRR